MELLAVHRFDPLGEFAATFEIPSQQIIDNSFLKHSNKVKFFSSETGLVTQNCTKPSNTLQEDLLILTGSQIVFNGYL